MLGLTWTCDWQGCDARMTVAYDGDGWDSGWAVTGDSDDGRYDGWIDGQWSLKGSGWLVGRDRKVWCAVHALLHRDDLLTGLVPGLELRSPALLPAETLQDVHALAERYPGELMLRISVPSRYAPGYRRLTLGTKIAAAEELIAGLLEYGPLVVIGDA